MLGSDKTHLNDHYGNKEVHAVYLSCGNVEKTVRSKDSARCWLMLAQIPVVKFEEEDLQGVLTQRLYHKCMDIATESLKDCAGNPVEMSDAEGVLRLVRTVLFAHIADTPEQQLIACVIQNASPLSLARFNNLGSSTPQPPRYGSNTIELIEQVLNTEGVTETDVRKYARVALDLGLNGVSAPFWADWKFADPADFIMPDALHQWHRFFYDHIMTWARIIVGDKEVDCRYTVLQKHVGFRHFNSGFTRFGQHTGRESRDLQRSFIGVIAGYKGITSTVMKAFSAVLRFLYFAQFETHTDKTLGLMEECLATFHANKHGLSIAEIRNGPQQNNEFNIPKLEMLHHIAQKTRMAGTLQQYSTEAIERCHITMAKMPYAATNRKGHEKQMCRVIDRQEKVYQFSLFLEWTLDEENTGEDENESDSDCGGLEGEDEATETEDDDEGVRLEQRNSGADSDKKKTTSSARNSLAAKFIRDPVQNHFLAKEILVPRNKTTAFLLADRISLGDAGILNVAKRYHLPALRTLLFRFHIQFYDNAPPFKLLDCWDRVRLQLHSFGDKNVLLSPRTLMAAPPCTIYPRGNCNAAFIKRSNDMPFPGIKGKFKFVWLPSLDSYIFRLLCRTDSACFPSSLHFSCVCRRLSCVCGTILPGEWVCA